MKDVFENMREYHIKQGYQSKSGPGSTISITRVIAAQITQILRQYNITSVLDAGCGDCNWISRIGPLHATFTEQRSTIPYYGVDITPSQIEENEKCFKKSSAVFLCGNLMNMSLPTVDLIICRDVLVHLNKEQILEILANFKSTNSIYFLATTFPKHDNNTPLDRVGGFWPVNLEIPPFNLGKPLERFNEGSQRKKDSKYNDKSLGLWGLE